MLAHTPILLSLNLVARQQRRLAHSPTSPDHSDGEGPSPERGDRSRKHRRKRESPPSMASAERINLAAAGVDRWKTAAHTERWVAAHVNASADVGAIGRDKAPDIVASFVFHASEADDSPRSCVPIAQMRRPRRAELRGADNQHEQRAGSEQISPPEPPRNPAEIHSHPKRPLAVPLYCHLVDAAPSLPVEPTAALSHPIRQAVYAKPTRKRRGQTASTPVTCPITATISGHARSTGADDKDVIVALIGCRNWRSYAATPAVPALTSTLEWSADLRKVNPRADAAAFVAA